MATKNLHSDCPMPAQSYQIGFAVFDKQLLKLPPVSLGVNTARIFAVTIMAIVFLLCQSLQQATAQTFTNVTGAGNPLNGVDIGNNAYPAFVDIDNDGDKDMFSAGDIFASGNTNGFAFYKNTGSNAFPIFTNTKGSSNPLNGFTVSGGYNVPAFVDIDIDGDMDMFSSCGSTHEYYFYQNTGTSSSPSYTLVSG
ncbi:MAG: hypothetical protein ACOYN4_14175, partial [Bacteroidales bacterium]